MNRETALEPNGIRTSLSLLSESWAASSSVVISTFHRFTKCILSVAAYAQSVMVKYVDI